ncbi:MAG: cytidylate kinase [Kiritimatiellia bacterium]|jgi:CMP/dCMP kinase
MSKPVIAIDGPSASGKSTVARRVARATGGIYVDSGALYRAMTWAALQQGVDVHDAAAVIACKDRCDWQFDVVEHAVHFTIDGVDPGEEIRGEAVRESVSFVARIPEIRGFIVEQLQAMTRFGALVMEGRDIGSVVFPDTPHKYYLDADPEERARRRNEEIKQLEGTSEIDTVLSSLEKRDKMDSSRKTAPLQVAEGAQVVNTTHMSIDEVVADIVARASAA